MTERLFDGETDLPEHLFGIADETVFKPGAKLDFISRELPRQPNDSGWSFQTPDSLKLKTSSTETPLRLILNSHSYVRRFLNAPYFSAFELNSDGEFVPCPDEIDEEEKAIYERGIDLISDISEAFRNVKREDGITLHEAIALDEYSDSKAARLLDSDTSWEEVDLIPYRNDASILCFLDAKGFRYYLPAYMIYKLRYPMFRDNINLEFHLTKRADKEVPAQFTILSEQQSIAVRNFLKHQGYREALDSYWNQF